jgi:hypothetical protein
MSDEIKIKETQTWPDELKLRDSPVQFTFLNATPLGWICTPIGGFGNHIRWMLTLDTKIQATINDRRINKFSDYYTIDDKMNFIINNVYGNFRSWNTWLNIEWAYRDALNNVLPYVHNIPETHRLIDRGLLNSNAIMCTVSPDLALRCYLKINSSLNAIRIDTFIESHKQDNLKIIKYAKLNNRLLLNADILYTEVLDRDFYASMIDYLGFDDNYESAAVIHAEWYQLHQKAEREFVDYVINLYRPEPNNNIGKTLNTAIGL